MPYSLFSLVIQMTPTISELIDADFESLRVIGLERLTKGEQRRIGGKVGLKVHLAIILKVQATDLHILVLGQLGHGMGSPLQVEQVGGRCFLTHICTLFIH